MVKVALSVVVPAYNESEYLPICIGALLDQGSYIDEIIVVDNDSTDDTADIIKSFQLESPKVVYASEPKAGVAHARDRGFDTASGDIIGRIDADTIVGPDWARSVRDFFEQDQTYAAVTGTIFVYESPIAGVQAALTKWRSRGSDSTPVRRVFAVPGSNLALRRSAWLAVRELVSHRTDIHEDIDLSLCLARHQFELGQIPGMEVKVSGRRGMSPPREYAQYNKASKATLQHHGISNLRLNMEIAIDGMLHAFLWPLYRMYDRDSGRISLRSIFRRHEVRLLPVFER
ncbi:cellulose synthase/poly-beta-1,6-N-acetylglucosamine synthase-like glycosyltransferase [Rhodococcus sp. 27YEA15]|uniref:glycosyltransferase family 2 protein n=1 Tax=Rhodococcus sp. 27YEA15 TaxID=3156259 RepID=UPI003C7B5E92